MSNDMVFRYSYSPKQNEEVQAIRNKYLPREKSEMDELKALVKNKQKTSKMSVILEKQIFFKKLFKNTLTKH